MVLQHVYSCRPRNGPTRRFSCSPVQTRLPALIRRFNAPAIVERRRKAVGVQSLRVFDTRRVTAEYDENARTLCVTTEKKSRRHVVRSECSPARKTAGFRSRLKTGRVIISTSSLRSRFVGGPGSESAIDANPLLRRRARGIAPDRQSYGRRARFRSRRFRRRRELETDKNRKKKKIRTV